MILTEEQYGQAYGIKRPNSGINDPTKRWPPGEGHKAGMNTSLVEHNCTFHDFKLNICY